MSEKWASHYEGGIAKVFDRVEPWAAELEGRGKSKYTRRDLLRAIGDALRVQGQCPRGGEG